ncbi:MAG: C39 family peptidase [Firmicutes bacterium]|nr:C39 family peptidase [Bacillota bacterium]
MKKLVAITTLVLSIFVISFWYFNNQNKPELEETKISQTHIQVIKKEFNNNNLEELSQESVSLESVLLNVPLILQRPLLPTGCEIVSTIMMMEYNGVSLSASELAKEIPYDNSNPSLGYVGDPFGKGGWTIYPEGIVETVSKYIPTAKVLTVNGDGIEELKEQLNEGKPVVVWLSKIHGFLLHSVIVTGYNQEGIYFNDPWTGRKNDWLTNNVFIDYWSNQEYRALSY